MAEEQGRRSPARVDHATLLAAIGAKDARGPLGLWDSSPGGDSQREACKKILAQVYRVVAAVLGPRSPDVADAAQEAFMRVHANIPRFVHDEAKPAGPTAWVNKIALRTALDHRAKLPPWEQIEDDAGDSAASREAERLAHTLDRAVLASALLERLDERHRAILILFYWNGETQEEIAATLSIPLGTVKTRMRAAHQRIRAHVLEHGGGVESGPESDDEEAMGA